ncbi:MAG: GAF domain-containing protein [Candidatus Hydrogenedentes bacterium]|nr:GAF domain-containing protein [Candidatus Hydrogenedentota bacterium]
MAQLLVSYRNRKPRRVALEETVLTIGRGEKSGLVLDDEFVSTNHAELRLEGGKYVLRDLASTNGTLVNGKPVEEKELAEEDRITIGHHDLVFYRANAAAEQVEDIAESAPRVPADIARIKEHMSSVGERLTLTARSSDLRDTTLTELAKPSNILAISKAYRRLEALYEASRLVISELGLRKRLESILDSAIRVTGADRGFIVLVDDVDGSLRTEVAREMGLDAATGSPSMGIASRSAIYGELVIVEDALQDVRFSSRESVILGGIRSAMSVPLRVEGRILGGIYVDSHDPHHRFTPEDLELFEAVASQSAIAIENVRLTERMIEEERRRSNLERFLSPRVVDDVINKEGTIELGGTKSEIAALFSDIRGFTGLAEKMLPVDVVCMLNEYFTEMAEVIFCYDGTLDKYMGDEIMAVFGAPVQAHDHALRAVKVALEMQQTLGLMCEKWSSNARPVFEIGIGIATGTAIAGYVGSPKRMEFTAIGDIVNVARRLCAQAEPGQILACGETFEKLKGNVSVRSLGPLLLKGKEKPVSVHEVLGVK